MDANQLSKKLLTTIWILTVAKYVLLIASVTVAWCVRSNLLTVILATTLVIEFTERWLSIWEIKSYWSARAFRQACAADSAVMASSNPQSEQENR